MIIFQVVVVDIVNATAFNLSSGRVPPSRSFNEDSGGSTMEC